MSDAFTRHCFIEFYYRMDKGFLSEHNSRLTSRHLNETYGIFNGCEELALKMTARIMQDLPEQGRKILIPMKPNLPWIKSIECFLSYDENKNIGASYSTGKSKLKTENGKSFYDPLRVDVNMYSFDERSCSLKLMHELTHAYDDYNRFVNGKTRLKDEAERLGYHRNNVGMYGDYKKHLSYLLYYITGFEINALLSELKGELALCDTWFDSIEEIVRYLKNTKVYKDYMTIMDYINFFSDIEDSGSQAQVMTWIRQLSNLKFSTYGQFVKYIQGKKYRLERKINTLIPKIAYENLQFGGTLYPNVTTPPRLNNF